MANKGNDDNKVKIQSNSTASTTEGTGKPVFPVALLGAEDEPKAASISVIDQIYEKINSVIGSDNPKQFFSLCFPGTSLDKNQFAYDIEKNEMKPSFVEANESKLVNKLFDAAKINAGDNGRHLQTQYKTALDMLTPRLNATLFTAKTQLRKVLMTPYPYDFGDGNGITFLTLQQVFFRLYNEYVQVKEAWAREKLEERTRLEREYPGHSKEANQKRQNKYLDWYATVAEAHELSVEEKLGKVLNVFSPSDMEIITGILESGSGRELSEARAVLSNVEKRNPDGGRVYPVTLYPENWFNFLDTSFTPVDLLESTSALAEKMSVLSRQRSNLQIQLQSLIDMIPNVAELNDLKDESSKLDEAYNTALNTLRKQQAKITKDGLMALVDVIANLPKKDEPKNSAKNDDTSKISAVHDDTVLRVLDLTESDFKEDSDISKFVTSVLEGITECQELQANLDRLAIQATESAMQIIEKENLLQYKQMVQPLQGQLEGVTQKIKELESKIALSHQIQDSKLEDKRGVEANFVPDGYTQIVVSTTSNMLNVASSSSSQAAKSACGYSFIFGGYHQSKEDASSEQEMSKMGENTTIDIGMSIAKVGIGREWFNPGVFMLSKDMYNTSKLHIAPSTEYTSFNESRLNDMNGCVFSCFPVAFVIARDISIKFSFGASMSTSFAKSIENHSASGGGFLIFGGDNASSSSTSSSGTTVTSTENSVVIRFTTPQILGYYLEATPSDRSTPIDSKISAQDDSISIFEFITAFQNMLNDHNQKYHQHSLNLS